MYKAHVSEKKKREVQDIKTLSRQYKVIGIVDMMDLPALQLQRIKQHLKDIKLKFTKKRLIKIAFDQLKEEKKGIENLKDKLQGMPALVFTNKDPFELAKVINKNQSNAPAKPGQIAPVDLVVPAGPTGFSAGPMIGELGALGIKTKVEAGKICIISDKLLVRKGEVINAKQADLLSKLGIEPMKIGLNLLFTYEDGEILSKDVLFIDEELYINNLKKANSEAVALALEIGYIVEDTVELLLTKAYRQARKLEEIAKIEEVKIEEKEEEPKVEERKELRVQDVCEEVKEKVKEETRVEEKSVKEKEIEKKPFIKEEGKLEKEINAEKEILEEEAPKDEEDKVVIEAKRDSFEEMSQKAKEILDDMVTEKLKKEGSPIDIKKSKLRERKEIDDVNKFINELKDKKAKEEK